MCDRRANNRAREFTRRKRRPLRATAAALRVQRALFSQLPVCALLRSAQQHQHDTVRRRRDTQTGKTEAPKRPALHPLGGDSAATLSSKPASDGPAPGGSRCSGRGASCLVNELSREREEKMRRRQIAPPLRTTCTCTWTLIRRRGRRRAVEESCAAKSSAQSSQPQSNCLSSTQTSAARSQLELFARQQDAPTTRCRRAARQDKQLLHLSLLLLAVAAVAPCGAQQQQQPAAPNSIGGLQQAMAQMLQVFNGNDSTTQSADANHFKLLELVDGDSVLVGAR